MSDSSNSGFFSNAGELLRTCWLELTAVLIIIAVLADILVCSGSLFVNELESWA